MAKRNRRGNQDRETRARRSSLTEDVPLAEATRSRYLNYALSVITVVAAFLIMFYNANGNSF